MAEQLAAHPLPLDHVYTVTNREQPVQVLGANFMVQNVNNVIIRNIQFENAFDCFPQWDPTAGATRTPMSACRVCATARSTSTTTSMTRHRTPLSWYAPGVGGCFADLCAE
jgi:hypothetical protein